VARAARAFGLPFCLSTFSTCSIEELAAEVEAPFFFQLYLFKDEAVNTTLIERAEQAGCPALILTVEDTAVRARRNRDCDNGLIAPLKVRPMHLLEMRIKLRWTLGWLLSKRTFGNIAMFRARQHGARRMFHLGGGELPGNNQLRGCGMGAHAVAAQTHRQGYSRS
jgi:L-lactate dehydrogenase (cytochrome)